ncbi:hypothetical protein DRB80_20695 [Salmonella enterica]|uniref:Uncharacterized protein n=3 Tax=Salmonella enterica TaxID=28901 RepID=A0A344SNB5_SALER|nr:hypothetical protein CHD54_08895 [Salmonella enterica]EAA3682619.1 hypothetical protein [Salmonella enterica subsp. houtenae]EAA7386287.1 hypothetical protein [Salmonella enterica subsp. enterica]EAU5131111.1 hypothetical protein [Salmonella enterica subsp. enterica serovar Oranienburg]EBH8101218.1 hypothetical protein [Salmonella enterica subsp. houtenae serovar O:11:g,z25:-]EBH8336872.1 hypothetical protein [Salmonella enterica subsp. houtenae serovar Houten]EBX0544704.1 hypothetical pro
MSITGNGFIPECSGSHWRRRNSVSFGGLKYDGDKRNVYPLAVAERIRISHYQGCKNGNNQAFFPGRAGVCSSVPS